VRIQNHNTGGIDLPSRGRGQRQARPQSQCPATESTRSASVSRRYDDFSVSITEAKQLASVIEMFRGTYGTSGVNLYSKLDVAVAAQILAGGSGEPARHGPRAGGTLPYIVFSSSR